MSETGELPCLYCSTEPPPVDEDNFRTCCEAGRHMDQLGYDIDAMSQVLNQFATDSELSDKWRNLAIKVLSDLSRLDYVPKNN
jgi:hypothetical protein